MLNVARSVEEAELGQRVNPFKISQRRKKPQRNWKLPELFDAGAAASDDLEDERSEPIEDVRPED